MKGGVRAALAALLAGFALASSSLLDGGARASTARFVPWTGPDTPSLALKDLSGHAHALGDYRGRVVLVNFWATWCEPCRAEMATMQRLQDRLAGEPFTVLLVNYGEARLRVGEFARREALALSILLDPNQDASRAWRVRVLPSSFLVDADGRVRYTVMGELDWASRESVETVQTLLR